VIGALPVATATAGATALAPAGRALVRPLVSGLVMVGLAASLIATVAMQGTRAAQATTGIWEDVAEASRPGLYYAAHAIRLIALTGAGLLAFAVRGRRVSSSVSAWFVAFLGAGLLCAARGMEAADFLSTRIFGTTGPWLAVASLLLFASARADVLPAFGRALDLLAWTLTGLVAWEAIHLRSFLRQETVAALSGYLNALYFPAAWLVLRPHAAGSPSRHLRWVPTLAYAAGSVLVQTRLNLVMLGLLVLADVWIAARRAGRPVARVLEVAAVGAAVIGVVAWLAEGTRVARLFELSFLGLAERIGEDSRTGQLAAFFTDVPATDLLLGRGARATWNWPGMSPRWAGGTDVGYLSLLFFGGIPLLAAWCAVHLAPPLRVLRADDHGARLACAAVALLWGARMLSSSFPSLSLDYEVVLLCVGACAAPPRAIPGAPTSR
jgi:hypothetical protein